MTVSPVDVAWGLIQRHGVRAEAVAEAHAAELRTQGDPALLAYWQGIINAVAKLRSRGRR
jgi:hypothetical protein